MRLNITGHLGQIHYVCSFTETTTFRLAMLPEADDKPQVCNTISICNWHMWVMSYVKIGFRTANILSVFPSISALNRLQGARA